MKPSNVRATAKAAAERCVITRQGLIEKAEAIYAKAIEAGQLSATVAATKEIGVLSGIRVERRETGDPGEFAALEKMSSAELLAFLRGEDDAGAARAGRVGAFGARSPVVLSC